MIWKLTITCLLLVGLGLCFQAVEANEYALYSQKEISKQEAIKYLPDSAIKEKIRIFLADSVELLGNVLLININGNVHAISIKDIEYKGRGKFVPERDYRSSGNEMGYSKTKNELTLEELEEKATEAEEKGYYYDAAFFYKEMENRKKEKEMYIKSAEKDLDEISSVENYKEKIYTYRDASKDFAAAEEFDRAITTLQEGIKMAKQVGEWNMAVDFEKDIADIKSMIKMKDESK